MNRQHIPTENLLLYVCTKEQRVGNVAVRIPREETKRKTVEDVEDIDMEHCWSLLTIPRGTRSCRPDGPAKQGGERCE